MRDTTTKDPMEKTLFGHPLGLYVLFFTEFWERFSYYGMRGLFVLYLIAKTRGPNPGWGWSAQNAYLLYGWYVMFVYVLSIPGGLIADKLLGQKKTVILGGWLLCAGHLTLAFETAWAFYTGLVLIVLGVGCLKPNISTLVGYLYKDQKEKKDMGFYIFYMGINLGAFIAPFIVGYLGEKVNWGWGFGLAGIGMILGQLVFLSGRKYLKGIGDSPERKNTLEIPKINFLKDIFKYQNATLGFVITTLIGLAVWVYFHSWSYGLLIIALGVAVGVTLVIYNDGNPVEKDRMKVIFLSFLIVIVFFGAFEQAGSLLNVYAAQKTDRMLWGFEVPATWFQSVNSTFILLLAALVGSFWIGWARKGKQNSSVFKMAIGILIQGIGFFFMIAAFKQYEAQGASSMLFLILFYLFSTLGELCASPVSLSFVTKLAPMRWGSFFMGAYFAATGLGNKLAGAIAESSTHLGDFTVFTGIAVFSIVFSLLILAIVKPLKRLAHGADDVHFEEGINLQTEIE